MRKTQKKSSKRWSARVTQRSNALDLEPKVFRSTNPHQIALSLKRSARASKRRKGTPYQSAMSMLNFYINRGHWRDSLVRRTDYSAFLFASIVSLGGIALVAIEKHRQG
jgi:hypothetical protein